MLHKVLTFGGIALGCCVLCCVLYSIFFCLKKKVVVSDRQPRESIISVAADDVTYNQMS